MCPNVWLVQYTTALHYLLFYWLLLGLVIKPLVSWQKSYGWTLFPHLMYKSLSIKAFAKRIKANTNIWRAKPHRLILPLYNISSATFTISNLVRAGKLPWIMISEVNLMCEIKSCGKKTCVGDWNELLNAICVHCWMRIDVNTLNRAANKLCN